MRRFTAGSSLTTVLLVLCVILGLGFAGWHVWHGNHGKATQTQQVQTALPKTEDSDSKPPDPSEGGKYLFIKEWGVRFLLPEELRGDLDYSMNQKVLDAFGIERIDFTSKTLTSSALTCDYVNSTPKVVAYMVRQESQAGEDSTLQPFMHLGDWYYMADSQCRDYLTNETQPQFNTFLEAFNKAIKSLQLYNTTE